MHRSRNSIIPAVHLCLRRAGEILLTRRRGFRYYDSWYSVPAGHVEREESPIEASVREANEETGIIIDKHSAMRSHTMYRLIPDELSDRVDFFYDVGEWSGDIVNLKIHNCDDVRWCFHR